MLKQLKYFQLVVRLNSFSAAAEENYISQSAISQQIQALERELSFKLFERKNRSFTLTPAGEYFYRKSLLLTSDYERMCSDPDVAVSVEYGNHEELYSMLRSGQVDLVLNDQRRAFSDEYVNLILTTCSSYIEVSSQSKLACRKSIEPYELRDVPCILVSSQAQRETEQEYYQNVVGIQSGFLYAENLEEARLMVIGRKGFLPVEGSDAVPTMGTSIVRIPLMRGNEPIRRNYCAFWKKDNSGYYVEEFARILKAQFDM